MKKLKLFLILPILTFFIGCSSSDSNDSDSSVDAPSSFSGKTYKMTVNSGAGFYATTGTWTVTFSNTSNTYTVTGDGVNVFNSAGSYTYLRNGNQGYATIVDSAVGNGNFIFTFTSETSGTYQATAQSDSGSNQTGSFVE